MWEFCLQIFVFRKNLFVGVFQILDSHCKDKEADT